MPQHGEQPPFRGFLSYRRSDNDTYAGVAERLKSDIEARFEGETGTQLELFRDKDDIGWGATWRDSITDAIDGSVLFIPIITMRYFSSNACRDELLAYHQAAQRRGVRELILPIIIAGASSITSSHDDDLVRLVESLNYKNLANAWNAGYESAEWRSAVADLVGSLNTALSSALSTLETAPPRRAATTQNSELNTESSADYLESDIDEESLNRGAEKLLEAFEKLALSAGVLEAATTARSSGRDVSNMTPSQRSVFFGAVADDLKAPSATFGAACSELQSAALELDSDLRVILDELQAIPSAHAQAQIQDLNETVAPVAEQLQNLIPDLTELETNVRMVAVANARIRKSTRPLTAGIKSLRTAFDIISSWQQ